MCCREVTGEVRGIASPFVRLLAIGYYDGPTDGIVECGGCDACYAFRMLDWDEGQDVRVFALAGTERIVDHASIREWRMRAPSGRPPAWVLGIDSARDEDASGRVRRSIANASAEDIVVATRDLLGSIDVWRSCSSVSDETDWFAVLKCDRSARD